MSTTQELLEKVQSYLPEEKVALVDGVRAFAEECHQGQSRVSGEPYMEHPLHTALFLADLHLDVTTICAALLHDVMEDCGITYDQLSENFGEDVAKLVDGVTKLTRMDLRRMGEDDAGSSAAQEDHLQAESLRKMLVAMAEDIRVVLIKLADRLHNMRTLGPLPPRRRRAIAQETLDIYTPLAHRLGIWDIKWRLEDMAFHYLEPVKYRQSPVCSPPSVRKEKTTCPASPRHSDRSSPQLISRPRWSEGPSISTVSTVRCRSMPTRARS